MAYNVDRYVVEKKRIVKHSGVELWVGMIDCDTYEKAMADLAGSMLLWGGEWRIRDRRPNEQEDQT